MKSSFVKALSKIDKTSLEEILGLFEKFSENKTMKRVYDIITQLQNTSGSKAKIDILRDNEDNTELRQFLFFAYEPTISYYQKKVDTSPVGMFGDVESSSFTSQTIRDVVEKLAERNITGAAAISWLNNLYNSFQNEWEKKLLQWLILRDIRAGVKLKTINKVWEGLLTRPAYMRCDLPKNVDLDLWPWARGIFSETKYDGMYANVKIYRNGKITIESRKGSLFTLDSFEDMTMDLQDVCVGYFFENWPKEEYIVFNGEIEMMKDGKVLPREEGNGILNSILQTGENTYEAKPIYTAWDFQPGSKFEEGLFSMPRSERRAHLVEAFIEAGPGIKLADVKVCYSYDEAIDDYNDKRDRKLEGTILKHPDSIWKDGTSKHQIKLKEEKTVDLMVVGFKEGKGKYEGMLGSCICQSSDGLLETDIAGFDDDERAEIWENREYYLYKILETVSNELMVSKKAGKKHSLFLGRRGKNKETKKTIWRFDKSQADSYARIVAIFAEKKKKEEDDDEE